jgi:hypothetical protein
MTAPSREKPEGKVNSTARLAVEMNGDSAQIKLVLPKPGPEPILETFGTDDADFVDGVIKQLVNAGTQGRAPDESGANFMLSMVKGVKPQPDPTT